ncbi:non-ribosomal peptide synthetase [Streptomyces griseus]|uniref:non-ribosomal peptide synthetase n=1 Tax=Streptomyces griseus TaxID=1911 RepID=UPI00068BA251|nr:non-ribosomal peptide synthetase [Streptomyces griseus]
MNRAPRRVTSETELAPVLMPTDRPRGPGEPPECSAVEHAELAAGTTAPGGDRDALLLAGFAALLHRCTGQERIVLDRMDATGRTERSHLVVTGGSTLREVVESARTRDACGASPVGVRFAAPGEASPHFDGKIPYELQLVVRPGSCGRRTLELHYDAALFDRATAARLLAHYKTLVQDANRSPDRPVGQLRLLTGEQQRRMLVEWNRTEADLPHDTCLHEAFEDRARHSPDATAVVHGTERWSYGRVNAEANRVAHHLRTLGVGPDVRVGLCLDRSPGLLVAVLGILKAGGAYVPLDPDYPAERIAAMVEGTACAVMISRQALTANLPGAGSGTPMLLLDRDADVLATRPEHDPDGTAGPDNLCYIIHTSGSTGAPKPIALRHRGVMNNLSDLNSRFRVGPGDAVLALSSPSFDMSVYEFLGMTVAGGTVVIPEPERAKDPAHWAELLTGHGITVWNSAPALLGLLTDHLEQSGVRELPALRLAMLGGDWVPVTLPDRVGALAPGLRFIVLGGATEASIHSTIYEVGVVDPGWASIPYGRPMANQRTYILDEARRPVPPGVPGELYLAGIGLARGYLDRPELTAERFVDWSYGEVRGERLYRTGDLARYGADGLIELLGRTDFQVKINGLRVELGEIEAVLRGHPRVREAVVVARADQLIAYVVPAGPEPADEGELPALVAQRLPEFMVPRAFVTLGELPLTPNGKLDRRNLPDPDFAGAAYRAPESAAERALAAVVAQVLGRERFGVDDDFLAAGGDSVRAIQVVTRARSAGWEITLRQLLEHRTVAALAPLATGTDAAADADADGSADATGPLMDVDGADIQAWKRRHAGLSDVWPLTPMQSGMLFESMLNDAGDDTYLMQTVYHLSGRVDAARLRTAAEALLERYANLRVAFVSDSADNLAQIVVDGVELPWREIDLGGLADGEGAGALRRFLAEDRAGRFDLAVPPLMRMTLVRLGPDRADLVLTAHHALIDGWSEQVLARDLQRLYATGGDASTLEPVRGFRDFLAWLSRLDREESARAWSDELAGLDGPTLVTPAGASPDPGAGTGEIAVSLSPAELRLMAGCCAELGVTANSLVQGAWAVLLSALTGRTEVVFGATVSGRPGALRGVESMVGLFINTVPVRVRCTPGETAAGLLTGLRDRQTALLDHHHHGLTEIHRATGLDALFDTLVVFQSYPAGRDGAVTGAEAGVEVTGVDSLGTVNYPLALFVEPDRLTLQYHRSLYDEETAGDLMARFRSVMNQLAAAADRRIAAADRRIAAVDLLLEAEHGQFLDRFGGAATAGPRPCDTLPVLFERQAASRPDAVAVVSGARSLTYGELAAGAGRLARALADAGVGPESVVALAVPCSAQLAVALLGTLMSGAAYLPAGGDRTDRDAAPGVSMTLTQADVDRWADADGADRPGEGLLAPPKGRQLACVRPAPGSRGATTGVAVSHEALADAVLRFAAGAGLTPGKRMLAASPHPAATAFEILAALCVGAGVEVTDDLGVLGRRHGWKGDVISTAAPLFAQVLDRSPGAFDAETVVFTGEEPPGPFGGRVSEALPDARIVRTYGPVETVCATAFTGPRDGTGAGDAVLGGPLGDMRCRVLSPGLRPLPAGVTGELYIGGAVARGYVDDPALTAQRFVADPYGPPGSRMYRTGDLARWNAEGLLEHAGRGDARARVRGRRVRTADVESVLAAHPGVSQAVVAAWRPADGSGDDRLVGYVVPVRDDGGATAGELREFVARRLPDHMVPSVVVTVGELPLTAEGAVDRDALPGPGADAADGGYREGRTPQEKALCAMVAEILGVDRVGIDDNFLALGVNSLMAARIVGRMHRTLEVKGSIRMLFQNPTVAKLSDQLQAAPTRNRPRLRRMPGRQA